MGVYLVDDGENVGYLRRNAAHQYLGVNAFESLRNVAFTDVGHHVDGLLAKGFAVYEYRKVGQVPRLVHNCLREHRHSI